MFSLSSGSNLPRGSKNLSYSYLPSARLVSWELHHDRTFPLGDVDTNGNTLASDSTCAPELRSSGCNSCDIGACTPRPCEFNQVCPNATDKATAAKLGGNGALVTHMVREIFSWRLSATLFWRSCNLVSLWRTHFPWRHNQVIFQNLAIKLDNYLRVGLLRNAKQRVLQHWHQVNQMIETGVLYWNGSHASLLDWRFYLSIFLYHGFSNDPFYQNNTKNRRDCHTFLRSHHFQVRYCSLFFSQSSGILQTNKKHRHRRNITSYHSFTLLWLFPLLLLLSLDKFYHWISFITKKRWSLDNFYHQIDFITR